MSLKRKLMLGILAGLAVLASVFFIVQKTLFSNDEQSMMEGMDMAINADRTAEEGGLTYSTFNLYAQDPVTVDATVKLNTDTAYFFNEELGQIDGVLVKDGQIVKKGDVLYNYVSTNKENQYALEDLLREQTKLYNQREELINQLASVTGAYYNYQGDQIAYYWGNDGKQIYYIVEALGSTTNLNSSDSDEIETDGMNSNLSDTEGIKSQLRQVNQQIEELEIKLVRQKEQQNGKVLAKSDGKIILNEEGKENSSVPLVRIISEESSVVGSVSEYDFYALAQDRSVNIFIPAENRTVTGKIVDFDNIPAYSGGSNQNSTEGMSFSSSSSNSSQFGFVVKPDEPLQPGFSAKVNITLPGYAIPKDTIVEEGNKTFVFLHKDGRATKTEIELMQQGLQQVVLKGLREGDQLILFPYDLTDGQEVSVIDPSMFEGMDGMPSEGE